MPSTVQELASMFLKAIDSQGNVLDMGVVKEVVTALERHPVSAEDLKDLKSTRLGKYVNQVRRAIPDKSLAKRMKTLVIQWRSLAQQSPSTPNGVPPSRTTPPLPSSTPPPSPGTTHSLKQQHTTSTQAPTAHSQPPPPPTPPTPLSRPQSSSQPTPPPSRPQSSSKPPPPQSSSQTPPPQSTSQPPPPSSRPPSSNPTINRKRALHRLSKFPLQQPQQPQPLKSSQSTSSSSSSLKHPPSSITSHTPTITSHSSLALSSVNNTPPNAPVSKGKSASAFLTQETTAKAPPGETSSGTKSHLSTPTSLHVRLPLPSTSKSFIIRIPLNSVTLHPPVPGKAEHSPRISTGKVATSGRGRSVIPGKSLSRLTHANGVAANESIPRLESQTRRSVTPQSFPTEGERPAPREERSDEQLSLVVSVDRDVLRQRKRLINTSTTTTPISSTQDHYSSTGPTFKPEHTPVVDTRETKSHSLVKTISIDTPPDHGDMGYLLDSCEIDDTRHKWTEPVIHEESLAVNILPYVYIDGLEEEIEGDAGV